jgi:site-specific recombinase XerC
MRRRLPQTLSERERLALLAACDRGDPLLALRDRCILRLMVNAGLRVSEVVGREQDGTGGVRLQDVDWQSGEIRVSRGKGGADRYVWIGEEDLEELRLWRAVRPAGQTDLLITTRKGGKLCNRYVRMMVKRVARAAGMAKDIHPHVFRHTFASDLYAGASVPQYHHGLYPCVGHRKARGYAATPAEVVPLPTVFGTPRGIACLKGRQHLL